jgi:C4-dicarboxylate-specific signal transduction histidine kinase
MHFDVTARRQAEAAAHRHLSQIAHLDRVASMGQLASSLAHELNQPLTTVLSTPRRRRGYWLARSRISGSCAGVSPTSSAMTSEPAR